MAMSSISMEAKIVAALQAAGYNTTNTHSQVVKLAAAIAAGVVAEIQANAITSQGDSVS